MSRPNREFVISSAFLVRNGIVDVWIGFGACFCCEDCPWRASDGYVGSANKTIKIIKLLVVVPLNVLA